MGDQLTMPINFYFDFLSPYSYLARHRLVGLANQYGMSIRYHAIDLAQLKAAIGNIGPANRDLEVKLSHLKVDLQRWADLYGIPLVFPPNYQSRSLNCGLYFPAALGREAEYVSHAFHETWGKGRAPDSKQVFQELCTLMQWNFSEFMDFTESNSALYLFNRATQQAIEKNIFGVPTTIVNDQMWWGNDRLFFVEKYLQKETMK